ncbi:unnamed protein product [Cyprideis torosa]|uniref:Uncharacterized protein n=1 Tax=Cyprideis torosa TaxID=163714 RepID=A0A7R8ZQT2_9CRUS|nr:unnamed protein product [Cyprideis torosa]CAG0902116.1 unnamed protein product [Cyprideis torosa]
MSNMGYNLSEQFLDFIMHRYDPHKGKRLSVADFILVCVTVQMLTAQFRPLDTRQNGTAAIPYEKFMEIAIQTLM